jgi:Na+/proline symporter
MLAARSERDALSGTFLFNVAHYALRPWPWILVALASMVVFPEIADIRRALPHVDPALVGHDMAYPAMLTFLPAGVLGMMVAGLLAAYVSTISTHLNWGTSYLVHDLYRRFLRPDADERHYVAVGRAVTAALMVAAGLLTLVLESARTTFNLLLSIGAGTGLLYLLRWFWWRINAWSEIAAMASSFVLAVVLLVFDLRGTAVPQHVALIFTVAITTFVWLAVTWLTPPTDETTLRRFYALARPSGPGWANVRRATPGLASTDDLAAAFVGWIASCAFVYGALFGSGLLLVGRASAGMAALAVCPISAVVLWRVVRRLWRP